jgi:hypothetical protein
MDKESTCDCCDSLIYNNLNNTANPNFYYTYVNNPGEFLVGQNVNIPLFRNAPYLRGTDGSIIKSTDPSDAFILNSKGTYRIVFILNYDEFSDNVIRMVKENLKIEWKYNARGTYSDRNFTVIEPIQDTTSYFMMVWQYIADDPGPPVLFQSDGVNSNYQPIAIRISFKNANDVPALVPIKYSLYNLQVMRL